MTRDARARRGGALVLVLIVVMVVGSLAGAFLQLNATTTKRQLRAVNDKKAFYLAEAGLTQGYLSLLAGETGAIGTEAEPAGFVDGLVWVESEDLGNGFSRLTSSGLIDDSIVTLSAVFRQATFDPAQYGIFSAASLEFPSGSRVEGFDSSSESIPSGGQREGGEEPILANVRSNGEIWVRRDRMGTGQISANLIAGPGQEAWSQEETNFEGTTQVAETAITLDDVVLPTTPRGPDANLRSGLVTTIDPGAHGFGAVTVDLDTTLQLVGPLELVVDSLTLNDGAELVIDDRAGEVHVYVEDGVYFQEGSIVTQHGDSTSTFTLEIAGASSSVLASDGALTGFLYAPRGKVKIEGTLQFSGAIAVRALGFGSPPVLYYDEHLVEEAEASLLPVMISWTLDAREVYEPTDGPGGLAPILNPRSLVEAVEVTTVELQYLDHGGTHRTYVGSLSQFQNWSDVANVLTVEEGGTTMSAEEVDQISAFGEFVVQNSDDGSGELIQTLYQIHDGEEITDDESNGNGRWGSGNAYGHNNWP